MKVTMRLSTEADRERIRRLAELDSKPAPHGDVLLAEVNGRLLAAMAMDRSVVADPFERTASVVKLLRTQLGGDGKRRTRLPRWLSRTAAAS